MQKNNAIAGYVEKEVITMVEMKAGVVHAPFDIRYESIEKPTPKKNELLIRVKYTGICGSDIPRVNGNACHYYPNVLGHEFSGVVVEVGAEVSGFKIGDHVSGIPLVPCMECEDCRKGDYALCKHYKFIGSSRFGSFAEYVAVPAHNAVKFAQNVSFETAAFFEPATVALHGLLRLPYCGGKCVAVLGAGNIGMLTMQWAKLFGAAQLCVFDIIPEKLEEAKRLGATHAINTLDVDFMDQVMKITAGRGFDFVYETAGNTITMRLAFQVAANKAGVCFIGTPTRDLTFSVQEWEHINRKEFMLTGSWMSYSAPFPGEEWRLAAHYMSTGDLKVDQSFIFKIIPLSKIDEAFELFKSPGKVKGKVLIDSEK